VWFFGFSLASRFVAIPQILWKMPWHRTTIDVGRSPLSPGGWRWQLNAAGRWGAAAVSLVGTGDRLDRPAGFADAEEVWHERLALERAEVESAECSVFRDLGLIDAGQRPSSAGVQSDVHFDVYTPPTRV